MIPQIAAPPLGTGGVPREIDCSSGFATSTPPFALVSTLFCSLPCWLVASCGGWISRFSWRPSCHHS